VLVVYDLPFLDKLYPQMLFIGDFLWYTTLLIAGMVAAFVIVACVNRKYSMYSVWRIMSARVDKGIRRNKDQWLGGGAGTGKLAKATVVAEIGPGLGSNMRYLSGLKSLQRLYLVEPNNYFFPGLRAAADAAGIPAEKVEIVPNSAADMHAIDSNSVDAVICTLVLCSVNEPNETIREVQRILKPGGIFIFIEHVAADPSQDGKGCPDDTVGINSKRRLAFNWRWMRAYTEHGRGNSTDIRMGSSRNRRLQASRRAILYETTYWRYRNKTFKCGNVNRRVSLTTHASQ
jgi:ubiquinone/menaquinone biosynthesis C-methylase UbiE